MHDASTSSTHDHVFGQDRPQEGERRTLIVVGLTAVTMVVEIVAGVAFGSMALLADGLHMASHAVALGIAAFAYRYARRHARDARFSFGTGKVNALAGYSGAVLLGVFALWMAVESVGRFIEPVSIVFDQAVAVAGLGLLVNGASVFILGAAGHDHGHGHGHEHGHEHGHDHGHEHGENGHGDLNLRAAYLHVLADALTSLLAIGALLAGKFFGAIWLDPMMGIVGAVLVARWSWGLLRDSGWVLLDRQESDSITSHIRTSLEAGGDARVTDLHVWTIAPGVRTAIIALEAADPASPSAYRERIPADLDLAHVTIEVGRAAEAPR